MHFNTDFLNTIRPPVMEARRWLNESSRDESLALLNLSQAAPVAPPPKPLRRYIADISMGLPEAHIYGPVLGIPELRNEIAERWSNDYSGTIGYNQVAITSGCNQAFTTAISVLARPGDTVMLAVPWYFNHKMWLDMSGIGTKLLDLDSSFQPDAARAKELMDESVRAIVLISPNNPCGAEYPAQMIHEFYELAKDWGAVLILDETYRNFHSKSVAQHGLFTNSDWCRNFIHLYSFSKDYRLTGHRVGAMIASESVLEHAEKFLDTVSICPNQIGQLAALFGLRNLGAWLVEERREILSRKEEIVSCLENVEGWNLLTCGAYFAYVEHSYPVRSDVIAQELLKRASLLVLPDTMFLPEQHIVDGSKGGQRIRIAFANADKDEIQMFAERLSKFDL